MNDFKETYKDEDVLVLICVNGNRVKTHKVISEQLTAAQIKHINIDAYVLSKRKKEVLNVLNILDEESAAIYLDVLRHRMFYTQISEKCVSVNQYFAVPRVCELISSEVFVDCGAYVGDTVEQYLNKRVGAFRQIIAFEPTGTSFFGLSARINRLKTEWALEDERIVAVKSGVGEKSRCFSVSTGNAASGNILSNDACGVKVSVIALDEYFSEKEISFIKADIEGFEMDMLKGAKNILMRDRPKLAICIYHNPSDMYQILLFLKKLNVGYTFAIRHHSFEYSDTVLYAWGE